MTLSASWKMSPREQRLGENEQGDGRRDADEQHAAQSPVQRGRKLCRRLTRVMRRQRRQDDGRDRDPEHSERKLDEPIGVIEPADASGSEKGRNPGVDEYVYLRDRRAEHDRQHEPQDPPDAFMSEPEPRSRQEPRAHQERHLERELDGARDEYADRECERGMTGAAVARTPDRKPAGSMSCT